MSFRVRATHPLLKPQGPPPEQPPLSFFTRDDDKKDDTDHSYLYVSTAEEEERRQADNRPKGSNQKGMAIRTVPAAQPDYM